MIRRKILGCAVIAALSGLVGFSLPALGAGGKDQASRPASLSEVKVPMRDVRDISPRYLIVAAAEESNDAILVIFYGQNREAFYAVRETTREAIFEGYPVKGMYIAKGESAVQIYADGQLFSTHPNPGPNIGPATKTEIVAAFENVVKPRSQTANQPAGSAAD